MELSYSWRYYSMLVFLLQVEEEQTLLAELKKIETRKKEREKKTADLQKLITAAETPSEQRKQERKHSISHGIHKKKHSLVSRKDSNVSIYIKFNSLFLNKF